MPKNRHGPTLIWFERNFISCQMTSQHWLILWNGGMASLTIGLLEQTVLTVMTPCMWLISSVQRFRRGFSHLGRFMGLLSLYTSWLQIILDFSPFWKSHLTSQHSNRPTDFYSAWLRSSRSSSHRWFHNGLPVLDCRHCVLWYTTIVSDKCLCNR